MYVIAKDKIIPDNTKYLLRRKSLSIVLLLFLFIGNLSTYAQHVAISNNVFADAAGLLSAGIEIPCSKKTSVEIYGGIRPWKRKEESVFKSWFVQTQYRFWPCQLMNGFFWGPYAHAGQYNIGNHDLIFGIHVGQKSYRYEGWFAGAGIGVGYELALAKHWNLGAEVGAGYTYINYKKYNCAICGSQKDKGGCNYIGISKLALSLIYIF